MIIELKKSKRKHKKWQVKINNKTIAFGDNRYEDYTMHGDPERKQRYIARHGNNNNINTAGFWALHLLWNKPTINGSIRDIEKKYNVKIKMI